MHDCQLIITIFVAVMSSLNHLKSQVTKNRTSLCVL